MNPESISISKDYDGDDQMQQQLPGFRFHPTDAELVGFYLRRKVDKKPVVIELIKQIDIYKHDPWDLPKVSTTPENEGYFFCKRGRKYRNSIRPNRVTGSGFWKATGIDKPVYSEGGEGRECIGLKKTLVYYRGSAGKGIKTDWMMQEFRLLPNDNATLQEAEVWTVCRIFKRNVSYRKLISGCREASSSAKRRSTSMETTNNTYMALDSNNQQETYISFQAPNKPMRPLMIDDHFNQVRNQQLALQQLSSSNNYNTIANSAISMAPSSSPSFHNPYGNHHDLLAYENWDELRQVVEFAFDPNSHP